MKLAIAILNYNGINYLQKFLPDVIKYSPPGSVVVIDNCSTDESVSWMESSFSNLVRVIELEKNYGFAGGYNVGLRSIDSEYVLLLNSDVEVTPNWTEPLVQFMDKNPEAGACQPKILNYKDRDKFDYAGGAGGYLDYLGYPFARGRIFNSIEMDHNQYDDTVPVFWASGAAMLIRSSLFFKLGGFDQRFFAHMEEIDLCWRIKREGYHVFYNPASQVYHVGGGTISYHNPKKTYLNFRNSLLMLHKNLPGKIWRQKEWKRRLLDYIAVLQFILRGQAKHAKAILKARRDFGKMKGQKGEQNDNKQWPVSEVYMRSIVYDFFISKKKSFKELKKNFFFGILEENK
jgi:GT2 family glycosyltransferase